MLKNLLDLNTYKTYKPINIITSNLSAEHIWPMQLTKFANLSPIKRKIRLFLVYLGSFSICGVDHTL